MQQGRFPLLHFKSHLHGSERGCRCLPPMHIICLVSLLLWCPRFLFVKLWSACALSPTHVQRLSQCVHLSVTAKWMWLLFSNQMKIGFRGDTAEVFLTKLQVRYGLWLTSRVHGLKHQRWERTGAGANGNVYAAFVCEHSAVQKNSVQHGAGVLSYSAIVFV